MIDTNMNENYEILKIHIINKIQRFGKEIIKYNKLLSQVKGLKTFIRNTLSTLTSLENASGVYLRTATNTAYNTLVNTLNNDKAKASDLLDQFKTVLDNLVVKGS